MPRTHFLPWPEAEIEVFDRLGGRDSLRLWIGARDFRSNQYRYTTKDSTVSILVRYASFVYSETSGRRRRLRVTESEMGGIFLVTLDIQPVAFSLEWLLWVLKPEGDLDPHKHRHTYEVGRLSGVKLTPRVEKLIGLSLMAD